MQKRIASAVLAIALSLLVVPVIFGADLAGATHAGQCAMDESGYGDIVDRTERYPTKEQCEGAGGTWWPGPEHEGTTTTTTTSTTTTTAPECKE